MLREPWPSMLRTIWGDDDRFVDTYWSRFEGMYFAGDGAKKDDDGHIWLLGRVDDVMLVSGHNISTTEVESALVVAPVGGRGGGGRRDRPDHRPGDRRVRHPARQHGHRRRRRASSSSPSCATTWPRRSARSPSRGRSCWCRSCRRPAPARSCAGCCGTSRSTGRSGDVTTLQDSSVMDLISSGMGGGKSDED